MEKELLDAILADLPKSEHALFLKELKETEQMVQTDPDFDKSVNALSHEAKSIRGEA